MEPLDRWIHTPPRPSATFDEFAIAEIRRAAATGIYDIRSEEHTSELQSP